MYHKHGVWCSTVQYIFFLLQTSESSELKVTSTDCLQQLSSFIGRAILKGRVEQYNPR